MDNYTQESSGFALRFTAPVQDCTHCSARAAGLWLSACLSWTDIRISHAKQVNVGVCPSDGPKSSEAAFHWSNNLRRSLQPWGSFGLLLFPSLCSPALATVCTVSCCQHVLFAFEKLVQCKGLDKIEIDDIQALFCHHYIGWWLQKFRKDKGSIGSVGW